MNLQPKKIALAIFITTCFGIFAPSAQSKSLIDGTELTNALYTDTRNAVSNKIQQTNFFGFPKNETKVTLNNIADEIKAKAIFEYAYNLALQSSVRNNMSEINRTVKKVERELDAIYNFEPLMLHGKVVPPVITESNKIFSQENPLQIRLTDKIYDIKAQARFASTAPNWRDYLIFSDEQNAFIEDVAVLTTLKPKNKKERQLWEKAQREGWELGQREANKILIDAMERLNRDYIGMIRFHQLVAQGKIDMPAVHAYNLYNTNSGSRLLMGEKLFQIERLPQFKDIEQVITPQAPVKNVNLGQPVNNRVLLKDEAFNLYVRENVANAKNDKPILNKPEQNYLINDEGFSLHAKPEAIGVSVKDIKQSITNRDVENSATEKSSNIKKKKWFWQKDKENRVTIIHDNEPQKVVEATNDITSQTTDSVLKQEVYTSAQNEVVETHIIENVTGHSFSKLVTRTGVFNPLADSIKMAEQRIQESLKSIDLNNPKVQFLPPNTIHIE